jgi:carboxylesterase type B
MMNEQAALRRVQQNIAEFGGNPGDVTVCFRSRFVSPNCR